MSRGSNTGTCSYGKHSDTLTDDERFTIVPSEIVLGPPKTTFASASSARNANKTFDSPSRTAFGTQNTEMIRNDHYNPKDKSFKDKDKVEEEDCKTREPRSAAVFGRRNGKEEGDVWSGLRSAKNISTDDADRQFRKAGERDLRQEKGENGDPKRPQRGFENHRRDVQREGDDSATTRRNGIGRGNRPSWYKEDDAQGNDQLENSWDNTRNRDWRDGDKGGRRGPERDWNRGGKVEQDPEWMLEPDIEEKKQTHTAEDIEQWKASMRAGKSTGGPGRSSAADMATTDCANKLAVKVDTPLGLDPKFDKFFGLWNEPKSLNGISADRNTEETLKSETGKLNAPKSSRFTGFFSPKPETLPQENEPLSVTTPSLIMDTSSNEDKAGFQRIMQMLGGGNIMPGVAAPVQTSQVASDQPPDIQLLRGFQEGRVPPSSQKARTPPREQFTTDAPASPPILSPRSQRSITLENLLGTGPQSPREGTHAQNSESEFLLSLMRPKGAEVKQPLQSNQRVLTSNAPGILPHPNLMTQGMNQAHAQHQTQDQGVQRSFFDEPRLETAEPQDKLNPTAHRRPQRGSVPNIFDDFAEAIPQRQQQMGVPAHYGLLPGLQRPPGFEQLPPNYNQHMQHQRHNIVAPPPGFQNPSRNPNQFPPGLIPNLSNLSIAQDRGAPPFGLRQMGPGPGALPPPGFMGMGAPPPGFPPLQDEAGRMIFSGSMPPRIAMDLPFDNGGGFGIGNGNGNGRAGGAVFGQFTSAGYKRAE